MSTMNMKGLLDVKTSSFTWTISNFSKLCEDEGEKETEIVSPNFIVGDGIKESIWKIKLVIPNKESKYIQLGFQYLHDYTHFQDETYCFQLSLLDDIERKVHMVTSDVKTFDSVTAWKWPKYMLKSYIMNNKDKLLINDTLSIFCKMNMNVYNHDEIKSRINLNNNYEIFHLNKKFSDITIMVDQEKIEAHKIVLSANSKVFAAMLEHDMKESNTHTIEINDISLDVMKELLLFMYCGKVQNLAKIAKQLLAAANKYDVKLLKVKCEKSIKENLSIENACETLVISDLHNCQKLKSETIDFIITNLTLVIQTSEFELLKDSNAKLLEEILRRVAEQKSS